MTRNASSATSLAQKFIAVPFFLVERYFHLVGKWNECCYINHQLYAEKNGIKSSTSLSALPPSGHCGACADARAPERGDIGPTRHVSSKPSSTVLMTDQAIVVTALNAIAIAQFPLFASAGFLLQYGN